MKSKDKKQEFENLKKTAVAHGTLSEESAEVKAKNVEEVTLGLLEKEEEIARLLQ